MPASVAIAAAGVSAWLTPRTRHSAATSPIHSKRSKRWGPNWSNSRRCVTRGCPTGSTWSMIGCGYPDHDRRPPGIEREHDRCVARTRLPRQTDLLRRRRDCLSGTAHAHRRPAVPGSGHPAVRCRALTGSETARSRHRVSCCTIAGWGPRERSCGATRAAAGA